MTFTRTFLLALFLATASLRPAFSNELPNDCAITATEAYARLKSSAVWSEVLRIGFIDCKSGQTLGHMLSVWQIHKGGVIIVYDKGGALDLDTHSQKPNDIAAALNKNNPQQPIFEARFVQ